MKRWHFILLILVILSVGGIFLSWGTVFSAEPQTSQDEEENELVIQAEEASPITPGAKEKEKEKEEEKEEEGKDLRDEKLKLSDPLPVFESTS